MADAAVSKTVGVKAPCGFESHLRHQIWIWKLANTLIGKGLRAFLRAQFPLACATPMRRTVLLPAGAPLNVVQQRLGHSKASTTLNIYAHVLRGADQEAATIMSKALAGSK
jgi:integrase